MESRSTIQRSFNNEKLHTVYLEGCQQGLGMKICGGCDENGRFTGIFVRQILDRGVAATSGEISVGNSITHVNEHSLDGVTQAQAISYLRMSAQTGSVRLVIDRSEAAQRKFPKLCEGFINPLSQSMNVDQNPLTKNVDSRNGSLVSKESFNNESSVLSDGQISPSDDLFNLKHRFAKENLSVSSELRKPLDQNNFHSPSVDSGLPSASSFNLPGTPNNGKCYQSYIHTAVIPYLTSLGISVMGGTNTPEGPHIYISDIIRGGDAHQNGHLCIGDLLLSVNGKSLVGITLELAKSILAHLKVRKDATSTTICYIHKPEVHLLHNTLTDANNNITNYNMLPEVSQLKSPKEPSHIHSVGESQENVDDPLLKELLNLMTDIQDSEHDSEFERGVFSPNVIPTPYTRIASYSNRTEQPPENTIPHYLKQDVNKTYPRQPRTLVKRSKNFTLDPSTLIKLEKLEAALKSLGLRVTVFEKNEIRKRLTSNTDGKVLYGDFIEVVQDVLNLDNLEDHSHTLNGETKKFNPKKQLSILNTDKETMSFRDEAYRLRRERDDALREVQYFRSSLRDKDQLCFSLEDELERARHEVAAAHNECGVLRRKAQIVSESNRAAQSSEQDYEDLIRKLEKEISMLQTNSGPPQAEFLDVQKRLVVLGCQLRKTEVSKRSYEVAVDKLTKFTEKVYVTLSAENKKADPNHKKSRRQTELADNAKDTVKAVKLLLEEEPLPFGWEEVYSPDGGRFYINHITQTTSWLHPISCVQHTGKSKSSR